MDFEFSEEQELLRKFARDFMVNKCTKAYVRQMEHDEQGYSPEIWKEMADMGWIGLVFPEEYDGGDLKFLDLAVLLEEMGRGCLPGPYFSTVVLGGMTILDTGTQEQKKKLLPQISQGKLILTLALVEPSETLTPDGISTTASAQGNDYVINGTKLYVSDFNVADYVICVARTKDGTSKEGITLFLVDAKSPGISHTMLHSIASDKQAEVVFNNVKVPRENILGELDKGWDQVEKIISRGAVGKCADMLGGCQQTLEMTVQYAKDRIQFGRPIGSFQAIQHQCANVATFVEGSQNITYQAAWMLSEGLPCQTEVSLAKAWVTDTTRKVTTIAHQVHGAIGFTKDHDLQLYTRRAEVSELAFGDVAFHREKVAAGMGL
ncbi:MAG: acyl-CoA/acyl-ACP dehydrogenase [Dehalococcoidia bacterium]|nr:acyl-CoA/acyl-ACP dehydrogenase [Dehalococcoidia bacterium]